MSFWAVNWAAEVKLPVLSEKLVLLLLANFANDDDEAWPRIDTLMDMTCKSKSTVHRLLQSLEAQGYITRMGTREYRENSRTGSVMSVSVIRLNVPDSVHRSRRKMGPRPGVTQPNMPSHLVSPNNETHGNGPIDIEPDFDEVPSEAVNPSFRTHGEVEPVSPTSGTEGVPPVGLTYKEEPPFRTTNPTPLPPSDDPEVAELGDGPVGSGRVSNDENETLPPGPTAEQWRVLRDCLPRPMQALDGPTALRVVGLLVERLEAGWSPDRIHDTLAGNALPPNVRSLGGLVLHRVGAIPVDGAPRRLTAVPRPAAPQPPQFRPLWMVEKKRAELTGSTDAGRPREWFMATYPGPSTVPADVALGEYLRAELRNTAAPGRSGVSAARDDDQDSPLAKGS